MMRIAHWMVVGTIIGSPALALAAEAHGTAEGHGLSLHAVDIGRIGPLPITNSMVVTWIVGGILILFSWLATRRAREVPAGLQNFWEWIVEGLHNFLEGIVGPKLARKTFWFFATIFLFIVSANWFGLIPGVGTVGWGIRSEQGFRVTDPILRGADADMNMTLAMALIFFILWTVWALQVNGVRGFFLHLFGPKGETAGLLKFLMIFVFVLVGVLEVVSILFRPVSLSFRLFGNIFAGENMLETMIGLAPGVASWLIPIPFYFLEIMVGIVQALVFFLLTSVFTLLICEEGEEGHEAAAH